MLVLGDRSMGDAVLVWIENAAGQGDAFGAHLDAPLWNLVEIDVFANHPARQIIDLKPDAFAIVIALKALG